MRLYADATRTLTTEPLERCKGGVFHSLVRGVGEGALYKFVLDGTEVADPYARFLPFGVHGPARIVAPRAGVGQGPRVVLPPSPILYEIHVGTFTVEGTYRAAIDKLDTLVELGVDAVELMPLAAFAGTRGWGYDGVALFAPFAPYGEPDDLRAFVDACHLRGLSAVLDVVYNHFGPSGNYLGAYSPEYFARDAQTAWGDAPDYANPYMRRLVLENVRYWLSEFGFDGLRLDAVHAIRDPSHPHLVRAIVDVAHSLEPRRRIFVEDERNDGGLIMRDGVDAVWADDFHHQMRVTLTGEQDGYYRAYAPSVADLARTIRRGWLYEGQAYAPTGLPRGTRADALTAGELVYCIQNHDQIGNRALGTRLNHDVPSEAYAAASMLLLFLPMTVLVFMGQEWAASSPFAYFTDHDAEIGEKVSRGRREEFKGFRGFDDEGARQGIPDPQAEATFLRSKLDWAERAAAPHAKILRLYEAMGALRRTDRVLASASRDTLRAEARGSVLVVTRGERPHLRRLLLNLSATSVPAFAEGEGRAWKVLLSSTGPGSNEIGSLPPWSALLLQGDAGPL